MMNRSILTISRRRLAVILIACSILLALASAAWSAKKPVVRMIVFLSPECSTCAPVQKPKIDADADKAGCKAEIRYLDVTEVKNYRLLAKMEEQFKDKGNEMPVVFINGEVIGGEKEATDRLPAAISKAAKKGGCGWPDTGPVSALSTKPTTHQATSGPTPHMVFAKTTANVGKVGVGRAVTVRFVFTNKGKGNLVIKDVRSSCACFHPKATSKLLAPGKSAAVEVIVKPDGVSARVDKTVMIDTNDPARPVTMLKIKAELARVVILTPPTINFGSIPVGKSIEKTVKILPAARGKFVVRSVTGSGFVRVIGVTPIKGGGYTAKLVIGGPQPRRVFENVSIRVNAGMDIAVHLSVFGNIVGEAGRVGKAR